MFRISFSYRKTKTKYNVIQLYTFDVTWSTSLPNYVMFAIFWCKIFIFNVNHWLCFLKFLEKLFIRGTTCQILFISTTFKYRSCMFSTLIHILWFNETNDNWYRSYVKYQYECINKSSRNIYKHKFTTDRTTKLIESLPGQSRVDCIYTNSPFILY